MKPKALPAVLLATCFVIFGCGKKGGPEGHRADAEATGETIPDSRFPADIRRIAKKLHMPAAVVAEVRNLPMEELRRMSGECLDQNHSNGDFYKLLAAEDLVADIFIDALRKPDAFVKRSDVPGDYDCRARQALSFLSDGVHPPLIPVLKDVMRRGDVREFRIIAFALSSFTNMEVLAETDSLLRHPDPHVATMARLGVLRALQDREVSADFRTAIWPACEASFLACVGNISSSRDAARLLVALDKEKAGQTFRSSGILDVNHPLLEAALEELIRTETPLEEALLLAVLDKHDYAKAHVQNRLHALALIGLAQLKSSHAEERIMRILDGDLRWDETLGTAAWKARFTLAGRTPLAESAINAYFEKDHDIGKLSPDERRVWLVSVVDSEFSNGGATQWFENSHGGHTEETLEALRHFGATGHAEILMEINTVLAPEGSVKNQDERLAILERLTDQDSMKLERLTDRWYQLPTWGILVHEWDWKQAPVE